MPHPLLCLDALGVLPISFRRLALPAANASGSIQDLDRLMRLLDDTRDTEKFAHCLPVFYSNLDPAGIPTWPTLATEAVTRAIKAINGLHHMDDDPKRHPSYSQIWLRLWPWLRFLHTHRHHLGLPSVERRTISLELIFFCDWFSNDSVTADLMHTTEGVFTIVIDTWRRMLKSPVDESGTPMMHSLCRFLAAMPVDRANLLEILDAMGGATAYASLVVKSLDLFLLRESSPTRVLLVYRFLAFLCSVETTGAEENPPTGTSMALAAAGAARALTSVALLMAETYTHDRLAPNFLLDCFQLLFELTSSPDVMCEALDAGLLRVILLWPNVDTPAGFETMWVGRILDLLPTTTVFREVASTLATQLRNVVGLAESPKFQNSELYESWARVVTVADRRVALMDEPQSEPLKACDNMECGAIQPKPRFRRCSNCQSVRYCSLQCQKADWNHGDHRSACRSLRAFAFTPSHIGRRDRAFMREMMHKDLQEHTFDSSSLTLPRLKSMGADNPLNEPVVTLLNYAGGTADPAMSLEFPRGIRSLYGEQNIPWDEHIRRAGRSGGRIELHAIVVRHGSTHLGTRALHVLMFPQWSERPSFHAALARVWADSGLGTLTLDDIHLNDEGAVKIH
ncbi:hypothetical protein C8R46DRAFT_1356043 [Mycena filopes]|nr:hypothetical protein C8R46DRAFT_1356043 [Mycena filopes]